MQQVKDKRTSRVRVGQTEVDNKKKLLIEAQTDVSKKLQISKKITILHRDCFTGCK